MDDDVISIEPVLLRVPEAARMLGIGRSLVYELIASGELSVIKVRSVIRVPVSAVHAYVERQDQTRSADGAAR